MDSATGEKDAEAETQTDWKLRELRNHRVEGRKLSWHTWVKYGTWFILVLMFYYLVPFGQFWSGAMTQLAGYQPRQIIEWAPAKDTLQQVDQGPRGRKIAICLVGGLRAFELTGPSIQKFLLDVYSDADVFVHAPVDDDVHKLTILSGASHLASAKLFVQQPLDESKIAEELLTSAGSPNKIQGLLQYFNLVEGCVGLIQNYETRHDFKYDWVVRTRVDGYWNSPMPPIDSFDPSKYNVPFGSKFGGLNDRLGVGTRDISMVALQRLSSLPQIHELGFRHLNSESSLKAQFTATGIDVALQKFPFCVMSTRRYSFSATKVAVPVASIVSKGPLNGAKCRPCRPVLVGEEARRAVNNTRSGRGSIGLTDDAQLCDGSKQWDSNWDQFYDEVAGQELAAVRKRMARRSVRSCIRDMELFSKQWDKWKAPPVELLCAGLGSSLSGGQQ